MAIDYTEEQKDFMYNVYLKCYIKYHPKKTPISRDEFIAWCKQEDEDIKVQDMVWYCPMHGIVEPDEESENVHYYACPYCGNEVKYIDYGDISEPGQMKRIQDPFS